MGVVAEYTADELAEDSDNEKRLEKAEKTLLLSAADDRTTVTTDAKLARQNRYYLTVIIELILYYSCIVGTMW